MRNRVICVLLCAVLALGLAACASTAAETAGGSAAVTSAPAQNPAAAATAVPEAAAATAAPAATAVPTPVPVSYEDAYLQFLSVYASLVDEVQRRVERHNAQLKSQYPESYYMHSDYLMLDYYPFLPDYPSMGSALRDGDLSAAEAALRQRWPDAVLTSSAPGVYEAEYTYPDKTSGVIVERRGECLWECDGATGAFRVRAQVDGEPVEFTEFIPQGNDTWLMYTMADKVLVTCRDGNVTALYHAHRINQPAQSRFGGDVRFCSLSDDDFYPGGSVSSAWITGDKDAEFILTLENGEMIFTGKVPQDVIDEHGDKVGVTWHDIDPIRLLK